MNKLKKKGIIYISSIPKYMNVNKVRELFSSYGKIERVYLQLKNQDTVQSKKRRRKNDKYFSEGWVEFHSKKVAKNVATVLNNTHISTKKRSKFYDALWNIKYLSRFKWIHLSERLAYEKAVHKQRLRTEIVQAKKEVNFFSYNVDEIRKSTLKNGVKSSFSLPEIKQRQSILDVTQEKKQIDSNNSYIDLFV
ncbi:pre-rRNA-processing protein esf2 [Copidosoma floridanum]|uniref:pre-rRNA-processing protein esf2 n=1 Tax=Copidosoma floridanum TaxID=29053 RepID=UPI0006C94943|nr:pre-rRNA-processing protein esf2 [Copidosoma floridanum]